MSTNPWAFADFFRHQPYPTMGTAPSAAITKTGGTVIQQGTGSSTIGETNDTMWSRIASAVPFGWTLGGFKNAARGAGIAGEAVKSKIEQGAQAVEGKVKSGVTGLFSGVTSTVKWTFVIVVIVAVVFFLAQVKSLFRSN